MSRKAAAGRGAAATGLRIAGLASIGALSWFALAPGSGPTVPDAYGSLGAASQPAGGISGGAHAGAGPPPTAARQVARSAALRGESAPPVDAAKDLVVYARFHASGGKQACEWARKAAADPASGVRLNRRQRETAACSQVDPNTPEVWRAENLATCEDMWRFSSRAGGSTWQFIDTALDVQPRCAGMAFVTVIRHPWLRLQSTQGSLVHASAVMMRMKKGDDPLQDSSGWNYCPTPQAATCEPLFKAGYFNNYLIRYLLGTREGAAIPWDEVGEAHLEKAKRILEDFDLVVPIDYLADALPALQCAVGGSYDLGAGGSKGGKYGWTRDRHTTEPSETKCVAPSRTQESVERYELCSLFERHNREDVMLWEWAIDRWANSQAGRCWNGSTDVSPRTPGDPAAAGDVAALPAAEPAEFAHAKGGPDAGAGASAAALAQGSGDGSHWAGSTTAPAAKDVVKDLVVYAHFHASSGKQMCEWANRANEDKEASGVKLDDMQITNAACNQVFPNPPEDWLSLNLADCADMRSYCSNHGGSTWQFLETALDVKPPCPGIAFITVIRQPMARIESTQGKLGWMFPSASAVMKRMKRGDDPLDDSTGWNYCGVYHAPTCQPHFKAGYFNNYYIRYLLGAREGARVPWGEVGEEHFKKAQAILEAFDLVVPIDYIADALPALQKAVGSRYNLDAGGKDGGKYRWTQHRRKSEPKKARCEFPAGTTQHDHERLEFCRLFRQHNEWDHKLWEWALSRWEQRAST